MRANGVQEWCRGQHGLSQRPPCCHVSPEPSVGAQGGSGGSDQGLQQAWGGWPPFSPEAGGKGHRPQTTAPTELALQEERGFAGS